MKKILFSIFVLAVSLSLCGNVLALGSYKANSWASYFQVTAATKNAAVTFPTAGSRDIYIYNGDTNTNIRVDLNKSTNTCNGATADISNLIVVPAASDITFYDFATSGITLCYDLCKAGDGTASPLMVNVTY